MNVVELPVLEFLDNFLDSRLGIYFTVSEFDPLDWKFSVGPTATAAISRNCVPYRREVNRKNETKNMLNVNQRYLSNNEVSCKIIPTSTNYTFIKNKLM